MKRSFAYPVICLLVLVAGTQPAETQTYTLSSPSYVATSTSQSYVCVNGAVVSSATSCTASPVNGVFKAADVGVGWGSDFGSSIWHIDSLTLGVTKAGTTQPLPIPGGGYSAYPARIAVDAAGYPWVVNSTGATYQWIGSMWKSMTVKAKDIGIAKNGAVWAITPLGALSLWNSSTLTWVQKTVDGVANAVAVSAAGDPYVVNPYGQVWRYSPAANSWSQYTGLTVAAVDLTVKSDGYVIVVGSDGTLWRCSTNPSDACLKYIQISGAKQVSTGAGGTIVARGSNSVQMF